MFKQRLLVICSRNKRRSLTAEQLYKNSSVIDVRSAGTSPNARHHVSIHDIDWATHILCMEKKHQEQLLRMFGRTQLPTVRVANIPDHYEYMDEELVESLRAEVEMIEAL